MLKYFDLYSLSSGTDRCLKYFINIPPFANRIESSFKIRSKLSYHLTCKKYFLYVGVKRKVVILQFTSA